MSKIISFKQRISNSKLGEIAMRMNFAGDRGLYSAKGMGGLLAGKAISIAAKYKDMGAMTGIGSLLTAAKGLAKPVAITQHRLYTTVSRFSFAPIRRKCSAL